MNVFVRRTGMHWSWKTGQYQLIWYKVWEVAGQTSELGWSWQDGKQDCFSSYRPILGTLLNFSCFLCRIHLLFYGSYSKVLAILVWYFWSLQLIGMIPLHSWFHSSKTSFHCFDEAGSVENIPPLLLLGTWNTDGPSWTTLFITGCTFCYVHMLQVILLPFTWWYHFLS